MSANRVCSGKCVEKWRSSPEQLKLHLSLCTKKQQRKEHFSAWFSYLRFSFMCTSSQIEFKIDQLLTGVNAMKAFFSWALLPSVWHILHFVVVVVYRIHQTKQNTGNWTNDNPKTKHFSGRACVKTKKSRSLLISCSLAKQKDSWTKTNRINSIFLLRLLFKGKQILNY